MAGIFINDRRDDAPGVARPPFGCLVAKLPHDDLSFDGKAKHIAEQQ
jgi:hypothetical protein